MLDKCKFALYNYYRSVNLHCDKTFLRGVYMESKFYNDILQKLDDLILCAELNCEYGDIFYTSVIQELILLKNKIIEWY